MNNFLIKAVLLVAIGALSLMLYPVVMAVSMMLLSLSPMIVACGLVTALVACVYALLKRNAQGS